MLTAKRDAKREAKPFPAVASARTPAGEEVATVLLKGFAPPILFKHEKCGSVGQLTLVRKSPTDIYVIGALDDSPLYENH